MRSILFHPLALYPVLAGFAALALLVSLRPAWPAQDLGPAAAVREGAAFDFGAAALAAAAPGPAHTMYIVRGRDGPTAVRLARTMTSVGHNAPGAVLTLLPGDAEGFVGRAVTAEIQYRPLPITTAEGLSLRWAGEETWVSVQTQPGEGRAHFYLPPPGAAPSALEIRIDSTKADYAYGLELVWLRMTPEAPSA